MNPRLGGERAGGRKGRDEPLPTRPLRLRIRGRPRREARLVARLPQLLGGPDGSGIRGPQALRSWRRE